MDIFMKIAFINGSPKIKNSASGCLLEDLKQNFPTDTQITEFGFHTPQLNKNAIQELYQADVWVFSFPLYVDGIPGQLLSCLVQLERAMYPDNECRNPRSTLTSAKTTQQESKTAETDSKKQIHIYGIANCGFYEGIQAEYALDILKNWCAKAGHIWGGGIGVGGGGGLAQMPDVPGGHGPKAPVHAALKTLAEKILASESLENQYVSVAFPRFLYKVAAQTGWRQMIRANGGKAWDLKKRPEV